MYQPAAEESMSKWKIFKITLSVVAFFAGVIGLAVSVGRKQEPGTRGIRITPYYQIDQYNRFISENVEYENMTFREFLFYQSRHHIHRRSILFDALQPLLFPNITEQRK